VPGEARRCGASEGVESRPRGPGTSYLLDGIPAGNLPGGTFRTMLPSPLEDRVNSEGILVTPCLPTALGCSPDLTGPSEK
jgi:hypothetical protein